MSEIQNLRSGLAFEWLDRRVANSSSNTVREVLVDGSPDGQLPSLDLGTLDLSKVTSDVIDVGLTFLVTPDLAPESTGLFKVKFTDLAQVSPSTIDEVLVRNIALTVTNTAIDMALLTRISQRLDAALVVRPVALVNEGHGAIALEVGNGANGSVHGELGVVCSETVTVGVRVREKAGLEDRVSRGFDVRDEMRRSERGLFDLGKVVLRVLVED